VWEIGRVIPERQVCLRAVAAKDARFDGVFYTAVVTTGIYCRPSCPVVLPKAKNVRFHPSAASAQAAGFRACKGQRGSCLGTRHTSPPVVPPDDDDDVLDRH